MSEAMKVLLERRSIRSYQPDQVPEETVNEILEAGLYAASGMGQQPTKMVVVREAEMVKKLSEMNAQIMGTDSDPFYGAPMVIVVFADTARFTYMEDGKALKAKWGIPESYVGIGNCILGYHKGEYPAARERKEERIIWA